MAGGNATLTTMDRDETVGSNITLTNGGNDSGALLGQVTLSSHQAFTVTPGHADNAFSANTAEISSALASIASVSLVTKTGATN
jgi:hypothetical protein